MTLSYLTDNILTNRWKERYKNMNSDVRKRIEEERENHRQLKLIKRKRAYPNIGDIFEIITSDDIKLYGIVINNHINNINGEDLLVVAIFKHNIDYKSALEEGLSQKNLILAPQVVGQTYWRSGYFYNIDHYDSPIKIEDYGFYCYRAKDNICDEYGNVLEKIPQMIGVYGINTIIGISVKINVELIIEGII